MHKLHPYVPAFILFAGCGLLLRARTQDAVPLAGSLSTILDTVPGYVTAEQTLSDEERRVAGMTNFVARAYLRDSAVAFTTLVTYYDRQTQGKSVHSPRNCLPGAGWEIMHGGPRILTIDGTARSVNRFVLRKGAATAVAYYWYQGRGRVTSSEYVVKWNLLRDAALAGRTEEALVRVVVPATTPSQATLAQAAAGIAKADAAAEGLVAQLIPAVSRVLPRAPFGS
jgi:EpsI family protein